MRIDTPTVQSLAFLMLDYRPNIWNTPHCETRPW